MKQEWPLVTIVMPAYNHELFVEDAIRSVHNQTYQNIELIVINDGSRDNTADCIQAVWEKHNKSFTYISRSNKGLSSTLSEGLSLAKGKYFFYVASDDMIYPYYVEVMVDFFEKYSSDVGLFVSEVTTNYGFIKKADLGKYYSETYEKIWDCLTRNTCLIPVENNPGKAEVMFRCNLEYSFYRAVLKDAGITNGQEAVMLDGVLKSNIYRGISDLIKPKDILITEPYHALEDFLFLKKGCLGPTLFFRTEALREVGGFNKELALEDNYIVFETALKYKVGFVHEKMIFYRHHDSNTAKSAAVKIGKSAILTLDIFFKRHSEFSKLPLKKKAYATLYLWLAWRHFHLGNYLYCLKYWWISIFYQPKQLFSRSMINIFLLSLVRRERWVHRKTTGEEPLIK
ncbi:MAG: hypothetical protein A2Y40_05310 [Candidatus Margulisbacteria bacterium GWF2_35_9]|nr:MAG: hypothetical protein A2Y40_05310 [Candidatus Margulisbacteria bacterium GWF2_35_9]